MGKAAVSSKPSAEGGLFAEPALPWEQLWHGRIALLALSVALLTLSYAPFGQFYLAWIGLAPWLVVVAHCRSYKAAFFWGWIGGTMFFIANMWWMAYITAPGMVGLMAILALYWGLMGTIVRFVTGRQNPAWPLGTILLLALAWTGLEFIRGNFIWKGLPWLYLGHTQTPILPMVQIVDIFGVYGVSFWVVLINLTLATWWLGGRQLFYVRRPLILTAAVLILTLGYGLWRMHSTVTEPGPTIAVIQPNFPQSNTGAKGATEREMVEFHVKTTETALQSRPDIDLVVWSETIMPPLNAESREALKRLGTGSFYEQVVALLGRISGDHGVGLITGGMFVGEWKVTSGHDLVPQQKRNSAYFFQRDGQMSDLRYDKIHIVPFGEFIPFKETIPALYSLLVNLGPPDMEDYQLVPGDESNLTLFALRKNRSFLDLSTWRLAPSICFEDIDAVLTAKMFRPIEGSAKRADVIVNLTNDGWFRFNEMPQHLQVAQFRSIENRVPTARSVNTGISGFVDSVGRKHDLVPAGKEGYSIAQVKLDPRLTFYTRYGDVFAWLCVGMAASLIVLRIVSKRQT